MTTDTGWDVAGWAVLLTILGAVVIWPWHVLAVAGVLCAVAAGTVAVGMYRTRHERAAAAAAAAARRMFIPPAPRPTGGVHTALRVVAVARRTFVVLILGLPAAGFTVVVAGQLGAFDITLWMVVGVLVGSFTALVLSIVWVVGLDTLEARLQRHRDADLDAVPAQQVVDKAYELFQAWSDTGSCPADFAHPARLWLARGEDAALNYLNRRWPAGPTDPHTH